VDATPPPPGKSMNAAARDALVQAVQANCHIADARHATELSLCTYLLQMREFFRWEQGRPFGAALPRAEVGRWIAARESLWAALEAEDYRPLPLEDGGAPAAPFDAAQVNARLQGSGLLYGAGLGAGGRPVFFLAELHGHALRQGLPVATAGREWARGLLAPPAVLADEHGAAQIVLRREAIARWGWERFEAFQLRPSADRPFAAAVQAYGLDGDFDAALPRFVDEQAEAALLHELGEYAVGQRLGPAWQALRDALPSRRAELYLRALRDLLADLEVTLPALLERGASASMHVWFAAFDGLRAQLFPGLREAYAGWRDGDGGAALQHACRSGHRHFEALARRLLQRHAQGGSAAATHLEAMLTADAAVCRAGPGG
jgi:hypothetical protein